MLQTSKISTITLTIWFVDITEEFGDSFGSSHSNTSRNTDLFHNLTFEVKSKIVI